MSHDMKKKKKAAPKKKKAAPKKKPAKKKSKRTTSKDLPGNGLLKRAAEQIERRRKLLQSI